MGAASPDDDSATDRVEPASVGAADGADHVDVVWFSGDDDYVVVAAGDGDRAVNFHRYGKYGVAAVGALFATLSVVVLHGFVTSTTSLAWPVSGVVFAGGAAVVGAYVYWRYDPEPAPEVVARDVPVDEAADEYDFGD